MKVNFQITHFKYFSLDTNLTYENSVVDVNLCNITIHEDFTTKNLSISYCSMVVDFYGVR